MVSFRKLLLALAVVSLFAGMASAQITCTLQSDQPAIRAEGLAELVGQVRLVCATPSGVAPTGLTGNFRVQSSGPNITTLLTSTDTPPTTAVSLSVFNPGTTTAINKVFGTLTDDKTVDFTNVDLSGYTPSGTGFIVRIDGIRVNAQQTAGAFSTVSMFASGVTFGFFGNAQLNLVMSGNTTTQVATVQNGLNFAKGSSALGLLQCNPKTAPTATTIGTATTEAQASIVFKPGFPGAFTGRVAPSPVGSIPASAYAGEAPDIPAQNHGTYLKAVFTVPAGATLYVGNQNIDAISATAVARNVAVLDQTGTVGATPPDVPTFKWVKIGGAGTQSVQWQVITVGDLSQGTGAFTFPVYVAFDTSAVGSMTVTGTFAPVDATAKASTDKTIIPRFVQSSNSATLITIANCTTTLLFPYVTTASGWDTGIAIANTSGDVAIGTKFLFGLGGDTSKTAAGQSGTCTVSYMGSSTTATTAAVTATQTTPTINAGGTYAFGVSGLATAATNPLTALASYSGFAIAHCNFQFAHGFAFLNGTASSGSAGVGYTALVLNPSGGSRLAAGGEVLGQ